MLLNHDMIVTPGWLDGLKRCLRSDDRIGAVSPVTNSDSYWTAITVPYKTIEEMELYACALHALPDKAKWEECIKLVSYCLLIRREAWEQAGPLDESFDMSDFEVDDYSLRLRLAGYRLMLGGDTFIHSSGENTASSADPAEFQERFKGNSKVFMRKWGFYPSDITFMRKDISTVIQRESHEYKRKACSIMELGCGCGAAALYLKKPFLTARWYGVEQNELAATIAETSGMTVFRSSEPEDWLLPAEGLDGIIVSDAHTYGSPETMKRLVSLLRPGGWVVGCFANRLYFGNIRKYLDPMNAEAQRQASMQYTTQQLNKLYLIAGFTFVKVTPTENKPQEELAYIGQLEQLADGVMARELTADYLLAFGRMPYAAEEQGCREHEPIYRD